MRTFNSLKNVLGNFINNLLLNLLRFVSRIIFVKVLSKAYLGVNGLLSNVLGLLALSELGISTAISYSLYEPLAKNDTKKIKALMKFYQKAYRVIALVVLVLGLVLVPFLPWFIKDTSSIQNLNLIYLIFLGNMVIGYLFSYKRTLIGADQKNYKITPVIIFSNFLMTIFQIISLFVFKNYIIYLLVQSFFVVFENITVNYYINKQYPYLKEPVLEKLSKDELSKIVVNIKALMFHKIGTYVLTASDNIIISKFIGLVTVGIYSNYVLVVNMINSFITVLVNNVTASFGNLIASEDGKKGLKVFNEMNLICFVLYGIASVCFINLFTPFIGFVFGESFLLPITTVLLISLNNFIVGINLVPITIQTVSGLYNNDRYVPIIQAIINIIISVICVLKFGIVGVLLGTLVSQMLPFMIKPIIVYKHVFKENVSLYFKNSIKQFLILGLSIGCSYGLLYLIGSHGYIFDFIAGLLVSVTIAPLFIYFGYHNTEEFRDLKSRILFVIDKIKSRKVGKTNV